MGHSMQFCGAELLDSCIHVNMGESSWVGREVPIPVSHGLRDQLICQGRAVMHATSGLAPVLTLPTNTSSSIVMP